MKLARVLGELVARLDAHGVAYAVVGGLAASARGEARFTRDINVAILVENDDEAEQCIHRFVQQGYVVVATVEQEATHRLATARLKHPDGVVCDLIFATCGIESEIVTSAERVELLPGKWVSTATAESMVAMKVLSASAKAPVTSAIFKQCCERIRHSTRAESLRSFGQLRLAATPEGKL